MQKHYYTLDEANRMIPALESAFSRMLQMRMQIQAAYERLDRLGFAPDEDDFALDPEGAGPLVISHRATLRALIEALREDVERLQATGCLIKGIEHGLVDWYATKDGRDIFLCWQLGEKRVNHWHEVHTGFVGRRPISELTGEE